MSKHVNLDDILASMPKRKIKRTTIDVPEDQIKVVDACAKALGVNRSNFLLLWFDSSERAMIDFTNALLGRSQIEIANNKGEKKHGKR